MANVLGLIGDSLSIYQFLASLFAGRSANVSVVRVAAALNGNGLSGADGGVDAIRLYNENQQLIGNRGGGYVGSGGFRDIYVTQPTNQQAPFVQIGATNDAICIPYVTTTWVDGAQYGWTGDWGYACGLNWYYGNVYVDGRNKPKCTWIDNDHTNDIKAGMLFIHFPSFTDGYKEGNNARDYCHYPALRAYTQNNGGGSIFKRDESGGALEERGHKVKRAVDTRIVITSEPSHNATALCESETSRGPDLVSLAEKVYCNMETRQTLPLCAEDEIVTDCFHVDSKQERKQNGRVIPKDYTDVIVWD